MGAALDQFYPWVHFNNSFTSRKMSLGLSGDVQTDFRVATDQMYPCVHSNNSFSYKKGHWNSVEMCRMTLVVLWANFTHRFIRITLLFPEECPWNSVEMCSMTLVVVWTNSIHGFTLITLWFPETCPWNSVKMCSITLVYFGPILPMGLL